MTWRLAKSLAALRGEVDARWPERSKISDGTLGDPAHAARVSDHNPNAAGVVRAFDCTGEGAETQARDVPGEWLFQHIITLGRAGHPALSNHGYVIHDGRAAYASKGWEIVPYKGASSHPHHVHISVGRDPAQYDDLTPWGIDAPTPAPPAPTTPTTEDDMPYTPDELKVLAEAGATKALQGYMANTESRLNKRLDALLHRLDKIEADLAAKG